MTKLAHCITALGYKTNQERQSFVKLMHASGILRPKDAEPQEISSKEAKQYLKKVKSLPDFEIDPKTKEVTLKDDVSLASMSSEQVLEHLNKLGQKRWKELRGTGERQQSQGDQRLDDISDQVVSLLKDMNMMHAVSPSPAILISPNLQFLNLGAAEGTVKERTACLKQQIDKRTELAPDLEPARIYLLGGDRHLWPETSLKNSEGKPVVNGESIALKLFAERIIDKDFPSLTGSEYDQKLKELKTDIQQNIVDKIFEGITPTEVKERRQNIVQTAEEKYGVKWPIETDLQEAVAQENGITEYTIVKGEKNLQLDRPDTSSTAQAFANDHADPDANICIISTQPHAQRQKLPFVAALKGKISEDKISIAAPAAATTQKSAKEGMQEWLARMNAGLMLAKENVNSEDNQPRWKKLWHSAFTKVRA